MMPVPDEFYIGYEGGMPPGVRRIVRPAVAALVVVAVAFTALGTLAQRPLAPAAFEFGQTRMAEGWLTRGPAPSLLVRDGNGWTRHWLVAQGKFGAEPELAQLLDGWVQLTATRITREGWQMLEIVPGTVSATSRSDAPPPAPSTTSAPFRARGEIVDSKCYLGVMNPGERTVHRDCAVRCLSGGIPAMFAYRDPQGGSHLALLLRADGQRLGPESAPLAGAARELGGTLSVGGGIEVLVIEP